MKKRRSLLEQAAVLSVANLVVRALGFVMRIWFSRALGAEAIGVMELGASAHMLWITPVVSGLPLAASRLTAQRPRDAQHGLTVLLASKRLAMRICRILFPMVLILSPWIAKWLGDERVLPTLWAYLLCMPILGLSAAYNGYCYGIGNTLPPALSEILEQGLRFAFCAVMLLGLRNITLPYLAAIPAFATFLGETVGLLVVMSLLRKAALRGKKPSTAEMERSLWQLSTPMTAMRLIGTLMRTLCAVLIPLRLRASGLMAAEATAQLGLLQGMALPLIMMPSVVTGALAMVSAPALAAREGNPTALKAMLRKLLPATLGISLAAMGVVYFGADYFAVNIYRQAELGDLLRTLSPLVVVFGVQQVTGAMLGGLGLQKSALKASMAGSVLTLALTYLLAGHPAFRLAGCAWAMTAGQAITLLLNLSTLSGTIREPR